jgi:hypothetical protein
LIKVVGPGHCNCQSGDNYNIFINGPVHSCGA